jgi:hypothetical protein
METAKLRLTEQKSTKSALRVTLADKPGDSTATIVDTTELTAAASVALTLAPEQDPSAASANTAAALAAAGYSRDRAAAIGRPGDIAATGNKQWLSVGLWLGAVVFCAALIYGTSTFAQLGYDWGYTAVQHLIGQPHDDQGEGAMVLYSLIVPTFTIAMFSGYMEGFFGGKVRWRLAGLTAMAGLAMFFMGSPPDLNDAGVFAGAVTLTGAIAMVLSAPFARLAIELKKRTRAVRLQSLLLLALLPWWHVFPTNTGMWVQLGIYSALMFVIAFLAPIASHSRKKESVFSSVFFATLPVNLLNVVNIGFTLFSLVAVNFGFMNIGWHATVSATLITLVTCVVAAAGGACGGKLVALRHGAP